MKNFSPQLFDFLLTHKALNRADLFLIELTNGMVITSTSAQQDIAFGFQGTSPVVEQLYYSTVYGSWERGSVTSEASYAPKSNSMKLTCLAGPTVLYPGSAKSLFSTVLSGVFDAAQVTVYTVYCAIGDTFANGIADLGYETKFVGQITKLTDVDRSKVEFEVADMLYKLAREVPLNIIQSSCRHSLFDSNCTLNQTSFGFVDYLASGSTQQVLNLSLDPTAASFYRSGMSFAQGKLQFLTGQNVGYWAYVKEWPSSNQLLLSSPLPFPVANGDALMLYPGCDKTLATCNNVYSNLLNNGSTPFVPNPELAL